MIAHRLVNDCLVDQIFVLDKGEIVERGTHDGIDATKWTIRRNGGTPKKVIIV